MGGKGEGCRRGKELGHQGGKNGWVRGMKAGGGDRGRRLRGGGKEGVSEQGKREARMGRGGRGKGVNTEGTGDVKGRHEKRGWRKEAKVTQARHVLLILSFRSSLYKMFFIKLRVMMAMMVSSYSLGLSVRLARRDGCR